MSTAWRCIAVEKSSGVAYVTFLDSVLALRRDGWSEGFRDDILRLLQDWPRPQIIFDLARKTIPFDHQSLAELTLLCRRAMAAGGAMYFCEVGDFFPEMVRLLRMDHLLHVCSLRNEALLHAQRSLADNLETGSPR